MKAIPSYPLLKQRTVSHADTPRHGHSSLPQTEAAPTEHLAARHPARPRAAQRDAQARRLRVPQWALRHIRHGAAQRSRDVEALRAAPPGDGAVQRARARAPRRVVCGEVEGRGNSREHEGHVRADAGDGALDERAQVAPLRVALRQVGQVVGRGGRGRLGGRSRAPRRPPNRKSVV